MDDLLAKLQRLIESELFLSSIDCDALDGVLDTRDCDPFDAEWMRVFKSVEATDLPTDDLVTEIRKAAYMRAHELTEHPDLCGYISDDFGLLADVLRAGLSDAWAVSLFEVYVAGGIPHKINNSSNESLAEEVARLNI